MAIGHTQDSECGTEAMTLCPTFTSSNQTLFSTFKPIDPSSIPLAHALRVNQDPWLRNAPQPYHRRRKPYLELEHAVPYPDDTWELKDEGLDGNVTAGKANFPSPHLDYDAKHLIPPLVQQTH